MQQRLWMGVCKTLLPEFVASGEHQNDHSYVRELTDLFSIHCMQEFSMVGGYTEILQNNSRTVKIG